MRTILIRTISGGIYTLLILGFIIWGPAPFGILMFLFMILSLSEFINMGVKAGYRPNKTSLYFLGSFCYTITLLFSLGIIPAVKLLFCLPVFFLPLIIELFKKDHKLFENVGFGMLSLLYAVIPFALLNFLFYPGLDLTSPAITFLLGFFILAWTYDTFAYLSGMLLGKHKLFERISPKKTWEGTIGGTLFSILGAYIFSLVYAEYSFLIWMGFAVTIVIFGTFGDLVESMFKRSVGLKDSGNLMPGHGGILDRMDSIILAVPFVLIYLFIVLN